MDTRLVPQLFHRPGSDDLSVNEKKKPAADARGIRQLVNRKKKRAPGCRLFAKKSGHFDRLARIQSIKRFIQKEKRLGRKQS